MLLSYINITRRQLSIPLTSILFGLACVRGITDLQLFIESGLRRLVHPYVLRYKFSAFLMQLSTLLQDFLCFSCKLRLVSGRSHSRRHLFDA